MGRSIIITTGGGTDVEDGNPSATADKILSGYTLYNRVDDPIRGTMTNRSGGQDQTLNPGGSYIIPKGFHPGTQKVKTVSLSSKTGATADPGHILKDKTGWRDGAKKTGTMVSVGTSNGTLSANGTYTVPVGWHKGDGKVTQSLGVQAATNVTPGTTQKTVIAASKWTTGAQTVLGNGNLVAGNIKKNVSIFGVTGSYYSVPEWTLLWSNSYRYTGPGNPSNKTIGWLTSSALNRNSFKSMSTWSDWCWVYDGFSDFRFIVPQSRNYRQVWIRFSLKYSWSATVKLYYCHKDLNTTPLADIQRSTSFSFTQFLSKDLSGFIDNESFARCWFEQWQTVPEPPTSLGNPVTVIKVYSSQSTTADITAIRVKGL